MAGEALEAVRIEVEDPTTEDARFCIRSYFAELDARFDVGFDPAATNPADADDLTGANGVLLVARRARQPVGCGALKLEEAGTADIKRMWVAAAARGLGLGRRLLAELEDQAAARGVTTVRLETNRALTEAIALYGSAGFTEVEPFNDEAYAHHWFAKRLDL